MVKRISALTLAFLGAALAPQRGALAMNGPYVDVLLGGGLGSTQPTLVSASSTTASSMSAGFGGRLGLGWNKDDYYTQFDSTFMMGDITGGGAGMLWTVGITTGLTFTYVPIGVEVGFDFVDNYSSTAVSLSGFSGRAGLNVFLSEGFKLAIIIDRHSYPTSASGGGYSQVGLYAGFPMPFSIPKTPWRKPKSKLDEFSPENSSQATVPPATEAPPAPTEAPAAPNLPPQDSNSTGAPAPAPGGPDMAAPPTADPNAAGAPPATAPSTDIPPVDSPAAPAPQGAPPATGGDMVAPPPSDIPPPAAEPPPSGAPSAAPAAPAAPPSTPPSTPSADPGLPPPPASSDIPPPPPPS